jgi:hypothetical protein
MSDEFSQLYNTTGKIVYLNLYIFRQQTEPAAQRLRDGEAADVTKT